MSLHQTVTDYISSSKLQISSTGIFQYTSTFSNCNILIYQQFTMFAHTHRNYWQVHHQTAPQFWHCNDTQKQSLASRLLVMYPIVTFLYTLSRIIPSTWNPQDQLSDYDIFQTTTYYSS